MKKFLLSSIILLGVCGAANAQTSGKTKKNEMSAASAVAAPTPQKAALAPAAESVVAPASTTPSDKQAAQTAPVTRIKSKPAQTTTTAAAPATVNAAGVVVPSEEEKIKADKAEKAKATGEGEKKNQQ
jgi:hypothetical protein